jgi:putative DNA methylase
MPQKQDAVRHLAYRLYTLCERKGWADEAGYYNSLVVAWPSMASGAFELR